MKKRNIAAIIGSFAIGGLFAGFGKRLFDKPIEANRADKFKKYYNLLVKWMNMKENDQKLENYFLDNSYYKIAIYGIGEIGELLYREIEKSENISVICGIDKNSYTYVEGLEIREINDIPNDVDVIVVTAVFAFNEIKRELEKQTDVKIVSMEDVIAD